MWTITKLSHALLLLYGVALMMSNLSMMGTLWQSPCSSFSPIADHRQVMIMAKQSFLQNNQPQQRYYDPSNRQPQPERISPGCEPQLPTTTTTTNTTVKIERIYFAHMRKAGGTTLRRYLKQVAAKYNLQWSTAEAGVREFAPASRRNDTLYITHFRDPVNRSISHFKYEGRWSCKHLMNSESESESESESKSKSSDDGDEETKNTTNSNAQKEKMKIKQEPSYKNARSLQEWTRTEFQGSNWVAGHVPTTKTCRKKMWLCSSNCYLKWLNWDPNSGHCVVPSSSQGDDYDDAMPTLERTIEQLYDYHMIVDADKLFYDPKYVQSLEHFFGLPGLVGFQANARCDKPSKAANVKYPLYIPQFLVDELTERNRLDYVLYDEFLNCGPSSSSSSSWPTKTTLADLLV